MSSVIMVSRFHSSFSTQTSIIYAGTNSLCYVCFFLPDIWLGYRMAPAWHEGNQCRTYCHVWKQPQIMEWIPTNLNWDFIYSKGFNNSYILFYYQISLKPLKTLSLSQVSFLLLFPLCYIVPPVFTNSDKGKNKGKKII